MTVSFLLIQLHSYTSNQFTRLVPLWNSKCTNNEICYLSYIRFLLFTH